MAVEVDELLIFKNRDLGESKKHGKKKEKQRPEPQPEPEQQAEEQEAPAPAPKPKSQGWFAPKPKPTVEAKSAPEPIPEPEPEPKPKRAGWFAPKEAKPAKRSEPVPEPVPIPKQAAKPKEEAKPKTSGWLQAKPKTAKPVPLSEPEEKEQVHAESYDFEEPKPVPEEKPKGLGWFTLKPVKQPEPKPLETFEEPTPTPMGAEEAAPEPEPEEEPKVEIAPTPMSEMHEAVRSEEPINRVVKQEKSKSTSRIKARYGDLKGVACTNHPWRQAYGVCAYCERPFCYPDTIPYNGKLYCLEDIDLVSRISPTIEEKPHAWTYISSLIFAVSAIALGYIVAPSGYFIVQYVLTSGIAGLFNYIALNYTFALIDFVIALMCMASAIIIIRNKPSAFKFSAIVLAATLIIIGYEYLNSNADYLFFVVALMFINMAIIAAGRMRFNVEDRNSDFYGQIDWPKPEVF